MNSANVPLSPFTAGCQSQQSRRGPREGAVESQNGTLKSQSIRGPGGFWGKKKIKTLRGSRELRMRKNYRRFVDMLVAGATMQRVPAVQSQKGTIEKLAQRRHDRLH